jgi:hypothetical protein
MVRSPSDEIVVSLGKSMLARLTHPLNAPQHAPDPLIVVNEDKSTVVKFVHV